MNKTGQLWEYGKNETWDGVRFVFFTALYYPLVKKNMYNDVIC